MKTIIKIIIIIYFINFIPFYLFAQDSKWKKLDTGLHIGEFESPQKSITGDSKITIIRIDPHIYSFKLLCADELNHSKLTAKEWCQRYNLLGTINAGMYHMDFKSNVGYMKNYKYINNAKINSKYLSVAAFNPIDTTRNSFHIFDKDDSNMKDIINNYNTVIQNLRLIKRPALNRWSQQKRIWSEAALGQDKNGNVLFIFSRSPYSMHDLNNILLNLSIDIVCVQHVEGGPEASLFFSHKNAEIEKVGSYETGFNENDNNKAYWSIPNVIGFYKKENN
jgi:hypothetical protein